MYKKLKMDVILSLELTVNLTTGDKITLNQPK